MKFARDKASHLAAWLRRILVVAMAVIVLGNGYMAYAGMADRHGGWFTVRIEPPTALADHPTLALLHNLLLSLVLLYGLYRLLCLMRLFEAGEFFSLRATQHLRAFAFALLVGAAASCLLPAIELIAARLAGVGGITSVSIEMDGSDAWTLLTSALFFMVAWIMSEARQLAEDNQLII